MYVNRRLSEDRVQLRVVFATELMLLHGLQVDDVGSFLVAYPQPVLFILVYAAARVALGGESHVVDSRREECIAVVFQQAATERGNPHEAVAVSEQVVDMVVRQSRPHVQRDYVETFGKRCLGRYAESQNGSQDEKQSFLHVCL